MPRLTVLVISACLLLAPSPAHAYIGPAIAFIGYLLGPVAAILISVGLVLYLPVRKLLKKSKRPPDAGKDEAGDTGP